jgi:acyl-coenzyme A thioesterase PaaI-like protein
MDGTAHEYRMLTSDVLSRGLAGDGKERALTLDRGFQGLPDTAHGGSVLAAFDLAAGGRGAREVQGHYLRRVPLGVPLRLQLTPVPGGGRLQLLERDVVLVEGAVDAGAADSPPAVAAAPAAAALELPISRTCFACGTDNPLGLGLRLRADDDAVGGPWSPPSRLVLADGSLAPLALTTLLDEAAFWLGALATGESGVTTHLRVTLHRPVRARGGLVVSGARRSVRARAADSRYWDTEVAACDGAGRVIATAAITFVAVRGAARRLVTGLLAMNPPAVLHRVFPAYAPPA